MLQRRLMQVGLFSIAAFAGISSLAALTADDSQYNPYMYDEYANDPNYYNPNYDGDGGGVYDVNVNRGVGAAGAAAAGAALNERRNRQEAEDAARRRRTEGQGHHEGQARHPQATQQRRAPEAHHPEERGGHAGHAGRGGRR